jgi:hypothetical protein
MRCIGIGICAMVACAALTACGLPSDGRVRPASSLSEPLAWVPATAETICPNGEFQSMNPSCLTPAQQREQERQQTAAEIMRIRTQDPFGK